MKRLIVIAMLVISACARHDDLPSALEVKEPPLPEAYEVETTDHITFHLSWEVDDPTIVSQYRLYWKFVYTQASPVDSTNFSTVFTSPTSAQVTVLDGIPLRGIIFCVSSVTTENVESGMVCAPAE